MDAKSWSRSEPVGMLRLRSGAHNSRSRKASLRSLLPCFFLYLIPLFPFTMTLQPPHAATSASASALTRGGLSLRHPRTSRKRKAPSHPLQTRTKISSDESSDNSFLPAISCIDRKLKKYERFACFLRHTHAIASHAAVRPVRSVSSVGASAEPKSSSATDSPLLDHTSKQQKLSRDKNHCSDGPDGGDELAGDSNAATTEGQIALTPYLTDIRAKVAARREYKRCSAAQARKRKKNMMVVLQEQVSCLTMRTDDLSRSNNVLTRQVDDLETQNRKLMASRNAEEQSPPRNLNSYASSTSTRSNDNTNNAVLLLLEALQREKHRRQESDISQLLRGLAAGQLSGVSIPYPLLQSGPSEGNTQLLNALSLGRAAPLPPPVRQAMQNQGLSYTLGALGARRPQYWKPLSQDFNLQQLISSMSTETLFDMLSQPSGKT